MAPTTAHDPPHRCITQTPSGFHDLILEALGPQATAWDGPPLYCVYTGLYQGVWKQRSDTYAINPLQHECKFCIAYSWVEARYTMAAGRSFEDILRTSLFHISPLNALIELVHSRDGWKTLYHVLLELFGDESAFILGGTIIISLTTYHRQLRHPPATLTRVLSQAHEQQHTVAELLTYLPASQAPRIWSRASLAPQRLPSPDEVLGRVTRTPFWQPCRLPQPDLRQVIDNEVYERMIVFDAFMLDRLNPSSSDTPPVCDPHCIRARARYVEIDSD